MPRTFLRLFGAALLPALLITGCIPPVNTLPTAAFRVDVREGLPPLVVRFTDESEPYQSPILAWRWDFGDGNTSTDENPQHTFLQPGKYTIRLTVISADGENTLTRENFIEVKQGSEFGALGPQGGAVAALGMRFAVAAGVLDSEVAFGFKQDGIVFTPTAEEPISILAPPVRLTHNKPDTQFFASVLGDTLQPAELTLAFNPLGAGDGPIDSDHVFILAQDAITGKTVPIPGVISGGTITAQVAGLPNSAVYTVAFRPGGRSEIVDAAFDKVPTNFTWQDEWRLVYSDTQADQLTSLRLGSILQPNSFGRRGFGTTVKDISIEGVRSSLRALNREYAESGLRRPLLVDEDGRYQVNFFNMFSTYATAFESAANLEAFDFTFGYLTIDPLQLLAISTRNATLASQSFDFIDLRQVFTVRNALAQGIIAASIAGYEFPTITTEVPGQGNVDFLDGLRRSTILYAGQTLDPAVSGDRFARSFGPNEKLLLDQPLLFPYLAGEPGYGAAGQDFFAWVRNRYADPADPLEFLASIVPPDFGILEMTRLQLQLQSADPSTLPFEAGLLVALVGLDEALRATYDVSLAEAYAGFAQDVAFELSQEAVLRASDDDRLPLDFNPTVFSDLGLIELSFAAPSDTIAVTAVGNNALAAVPPMTSRAMVFDVSPLTTEVVLSFNADAWLEDGDGNSVEVAAYVPGEPAVRLLPGESELVVTGFQQPADGCLDQLVVIASNVSLNQLNAIEVTATAVSGLDIAEDEVLDAYIAACQGDFSYTYDAFTTVPGTGSRLYQLTLNSGAWRGDEDVDGGIWTHSLSLIEPSSVIGETALLFITGGDTGDIPTAELTVLAQIAEDTNSIIAVLGAVPNQPLRFEGGTTLRREDAIIAYSFDEYLTGFEDGAPDKTWPVLLPMTRAAVHAMDATQEFFATGSISRTIRSFVVGGASKRGWTTWLTAAADRRVVGIIPLVIDVLNMDEQMAHHFRSYGFFAPALQDYVNEDVFTRLSTPQGQSLLSIVDPLTFVDRLTMPKFIANSTGDQFFLPDSSRFYLDQLPGDNKVYYAPNTDHGLSSGALLRLDENTVKSIEAWYLSVVRGIARPTFNYQLIGTSQIVVNTNPKPTKVLLWQATNPTARDFRLETFGPNWQSTELTSQTNTYSASVQTPADGWRAFFVQAFFDGPDPALDVPYGFSTPVLVTPDQYPDER